MAIWYPRNADEWSIGKAECQPVHPPASCQLCANLCIFRDLVFLIGGSTGSDSLSVLKLQGKKMII